MKTSISGTGSPASNAAAGEGEKKSINGELWQACAGPLVNMPAAGTHVVYFPQGHSEQVAASMKKDANAQIPNYPNLPSKLLCLLRNVTLHADIETDEVYAQMTLQPVPSFDKEALMRSDLSMKSHRPQTEFFCKTLTASDTSTHGGFSVPRRAAEKIFPPLDFTMQPPAQEIVARDLHDNVWTFRHIYRGQPKRHLLTTGWSLFIGGKRLIAGDSVLFIRDEKQQLLLGIRRANRQPANMSSSVLSSDSMHIGILAAAAHAAANNSPFTVFYNPRASPTEFVIPLAKYYKAVCSNQISLGMRFRMMFETEESGTRRYMGTITGISDLDPVRWKNSQWRNLQVGWDESTAGERRNRVSVWEIEPVTAPFFICPTPPLFRSKLPRMPDDDSSSDLDSLFRRSKMPWLGDEFGSKDPQASMPGFSLVQWMNMQQNPSIQPNYLPNSILQNLNGTDISRQLGGGLPSNHQISHPQNMQFNTQRPAQPVQQQFDQLQKLPSPNFNPLGSIIQPQQHQLADITQPPRQNLIGQSQNFPSSHLASLVVQPQNVQNHQIQRNVPQNLPQQQQQIMSHNQSQENIMQSQPSDHASQQQMHISDNQIQLQILQKMHQQQQSFLSQQQPSQTTLLHDQRKQILDLPQNFSRPMATSQMPEPSQSTTPTMHNNAQLTRNNNFQFAQPPQQSRILSDLPEHAGNTLSPIANRLSSGRSNILAGGPNRPPSAATDDDPSCSTSPSTNNSPNAANIYNSSVGLRETISSNSSLVKDLDPKSKVGNPSPNVSKIQSQGIFASYLNGGGPQIDYLDSSSSATSVLSHNNSMSFNSQSMMFRDASQDVDVHGGDPGSNVPFGAQGDNHQLAMPMMPDPSLITKNMMGANIDFSNEGGLLSTYENPKEAQPELSSSMVSQSFGVPDMAFNSIDSSINDVNFMNSGAWAAPQIPRMRTYTKVYKRGAVGRSIDITRYSGYDELKQDLARRFGIEGQLEGRQRIGWKLVYVDNENDVLLVGDDPWEEFVSCVRCIKILSPQEVQQLSLDGDLGSNVLPNQACSSSDNGVG